MCAATCLLSVAKVCIFGTIFLGERREICMAPYDPITSDGEQWCVGPFLEVPQRGFAQRSAGKGGKPPNCLLWFMSLATSSLLMWKQPMPAGYSPNTSSRGWIRRQNPHKTRLNVQTQGCDLWTADSKMSQTETLGMTPLSSQTSFKPA